MSVLAPGRNLVLIGLMGSGKTTVGRLLGARLGRPFLDTDDVVELVTGKAVPDIFASEGERAFRGYEAAAVRHVSALRGQVIAVGGGAVIDPYNVTALRSTGDLVLLDAMAAILARRVAGTGAQGRPLLAGAGDLTARLAELQDARRPHYRGAASYTVDTSGRTPDEIADEILDWAVTRHGLLAREEARGVSSGDGLIGEARGADHQSEEAMGVSSAEVVPEEARQPRTPDPNGGRDS